MMWLRNALSVTKFTVSTAETASLYTILKYIVTENRESQIPSAIRRLANVGEQIPVA